MACKQKHSMTIESYDYRMTYGYGSMSRLVCSCGFATEWGHSDENTAEAHRRSVVEEALGLKFSVTRNHLGER